MRIVAIVFAALALSSATALGGDIAVPVSTLDSMGLAGMDRLSDQDGLAVRGRGVFDSFLGWLIPAFSFEAPAVDPPTPESPFASSPFGDKSFLGDLPGGSQHFGQGASIGANTINFGGSFK